MRRFSRSDDGPLRTAIALVCLSAASCAPRPAPTLTAVAATSVAPATPSPEIAAADRLRDSGKLIEAVEAYSAVAQANPAFALPMERIGETLLRNGQFADAIEALAEAQTRAGGPGRADALMARAVLGEGRIDDALRLARTARERVPSEPLTLEVLAEVHGRRGETGEQIAALTALVAARHDAATLELLGRAQFPAQQFSELLRTADDLKTLDPAASEGYLWSAFARFYVGGEDELATGIADARTAIEKMPKSYRAHLILGRLLRRKRDWKPAIAALEASARLAPNRPDPFVDLAAAYAATGRPTDAARARRRLAAGQAEVSRTEELLRRARRAPDNLDVQLDAFAAARGQGNQRGAAEALSNAARIAPNDPRVRRLVQAWHGDAE